jgi:hypothetical protein
MTPTEVKPTGGRGRRTRAAVFAALGLALAGCGGEPSARELKNRQEFEALLTAVALKDRKELDRDARRIDARHAAGELSDGGYNDLREIIEKARAGDWAGAERRAYEFREGHPYFK